MSSTSSRVQPARRIAFEVIRAVHESDAYANLLLPVRLGRAKLSTADAGLTTELTYGTLRMQGYYDAVIALVAGRPVDRIDSPVRDVLRLATHQLLSMRVAPHAAVDEAVTLAREVGSRSASGFVNGVLRTITRSSSEEWRERVLSTAKNTDERLSLHFSHPLWIVRALRQALEAESAETELEALLAADNAAPAVSLAALPGLTTPDELDQGPGLLSPIAATLRGGDPTRLSAVRAGRARVQDEGSQLAALALSRARPAKPAERWLDICAGPGGKAALLAAEANGMGATLIANEVVPSRAQLVRSALSPFATPPEVWERDGREIGADNVGAFDRILLDAPCTGLGALRRRPEARWRKQPSDVGQLGPLQRDLLSSAILALAPGGLLAYVTCSPHVGETRAIVSDALARHPSLTPVDTPAVLETVVGRSLGLPDRPHAQLWPHRHGTDAMFIQLLTRS